MTIDFALKVQSLLKLITFNVGAYGNIVESSTKTFSLNGSEYFVIGVLTQGTPNSEDLN